jgi:hypothetical protein
LHLPDLRVYTKPKRRETSKKRKKVLDWQKSVALTCDHLSKYYDVGEVDTSYATIYTWSRGNRFTQGGEALYVKTQATMHSHRSF